jgi:hypothetical protein
VPCTSCGRPLRPGSIRNAIIRGRSPMAMRCLACKAAKTGLCPGPGTRRCPKRAPLPPSAFTASNIRRRAPGEPPRCATCAANARVQRLGRKRPYCACGRILRTEATRRRGSCRACVPRKS